MRKFLLKTETNKIKKKEQIMHKKENAFGIMIISFILVNIVKTDCKSLKFSACAINETV